MCLAKSEYGLYYEFLGLASVKMIADMSVRDVIGNFAG